MKQSLFTLGVLAAALAPTPARASHDDLQIIIGIASVPASIALAGLVTTIGNGVIASHGDGPIQGWLVTGYVFGGLNVVSGITLLSFVGQEPTFFLATGLPVLTLGALGILAASLSRVESKPESGAWIFPLVVPEASGGVTVGLGLDVLELF